MVFKAEIEYLLAFLEFLFVWFDQPLKSSLERSHKLNESIKKPFRQVVWLGGAL